MPRYLVSYETYASAVIEIEADSPQDALDASWDEIPGGLCHQCSRSVTLGDFEPRGTETDGDLGAVELLDAGR